MEWSSFKRRKDPQKQGRFMNYQKINASLSAALSENPLNDEPVLIVFISTTAPPDDDQLAELKRLGVKEAGASEDMFTARISSRAVAELSDQPWVRLISLSQQLKPL
jgi:hypothetical protein